jgi:hypothetical protein
MTTATTPTTPRTQPFDDALALPKFRRDPILEELWAIKAEINKEAGYDVKRLLADAQATAQGLGFTQYAVLPKK